MKNWRIGAINKAWRTIGLEAACAMAKGFILMGTLPRTFKISNTAAMLDGEWYFGDYNELNHEYTIITINNHTINIDIFKDKEYSIAKEIAAKYKTLSEENEKEYREYLDSIAGYSLPFGISAEDSEGTRENLKYIDSVCR